MRDESGLGGPRDDEVERILSGRTAAADDADLAAFLGQIREAYARPPSDNTRERHLAAMGAVQADRSRKAAQGRRPRRRPWVGRAGGHAGIATRGLERRGVLTRGRLAAGLACAALALPLGTAGLATAGVVLPEAVRAPFDEVGITLPNQSTAEDVRTVIDATPPDERGCAFGQSVAKAAGGQASPNGPCVDRRRSVEDALRRGAGRPASAPGGPRHAAPDSTGRSTSRGAADSGAGDAAPVTAPHKATANGTNAAGAAGGSPAEGRAHGGTGSGRANAGVPPEGRSTGQSSAEQGSSSQGPDGRPTGEAGASGQSAAGERGSSREDSPGQQGAGERP